MEGGLTEVIDGRRGLLGAEGYDGRQGRSPFPIVEGAVEGNPALEVPMG